MNEYRQKLLSISAPKGVKAKRTVAKENGSTVVTTEHPDRQDVTVTPAPVRFKARMHRSGSKRGQIAEVRLKTQRERRADGQG